MVLASNIQVAQNIGFGIIALMMILAGVGVIASRNVFEAAGAAGVKRLVLGSEERLGEIKATAASMLRAVEGLQPFAQLFGLAHRRRLRRHEVRHGARRRLHALLGRIAADSVRVGEGAGVQRRRRGICRVVGRVDRSDSADGVRRCNGRGHQLERLQRRRWACNCGPPLRPRVLLRGPSRRQPVHC